MNAPSESGTAYPPLTAAAVARHYHARYPGLLDSFVIDSSDAKLEREIGSLGMGVVVTDTVMRDDSDKRRLARRILQLADEL